MNYVYQAYRSRLLRHEIIAWTEGSRYGGTCRHEPFITRNQMENVAARVRA